MVLAPAKKKKKTTTKNQLGTNLLPTKFISKLVLDFNTMYTYCVCIPVITAATTKNMDDFHCVGHAYSFVVHDDTCQLENQSCFSLCVYRLFETLDSRERSLAHWKGMLGVDICRNGALSPVAKM